MTLVNRTRGAVAQVAGLRPVRGGWLQRRRQRHYDDQEAASLAAVWRDLAVGLELHQRRSGTLGAVIRLPEPISVRPGPEPGIMVRLLPGQCVSDLAEAAPAIAQEFGYGHARIRAIANKWAEVQLLRRDPLSVPVVLVGPGLRDATSPLLLGYDEDGVAVAASLLDWRHIITQGQTGAGKSTWLYSVLMQLAAARDVIIAGSDPSNVLLRPFRGTVHEPWQATGSTVDHHLEVLHRLEDELDDRLAAIPEDTDQLTSDEGCPLVVVVLEEFAGLLRMAAALGPRDGKNTVDEIKRVVARVVSEGRKAVMFAVIAVNRADTTYLPGFDRGQANTRVTFRVDNADAVTMLHPGGRDLAEQHTTAPSGVALLTAAGMALTRMRAPHVTGYRAYSDAIRARAACLPGSGA